ncbi:MAG: 7-carboxy-7-deazaguanine synthase QueE [Thermoguttaceae bacterium]|jgi:7-carboxy-7-deazaguanine synthase
MRIAEIFRSKQGEGMWTGVDSTFVRLIGCNLRCWFCDTTYASWQCEEGETLTVEEVVNRVVQHGTRHAVLTGGEPMLSAELIPLSRILSEHGLKITIETAGTLELPVTCDLMSISPKLANSSPWGAKDSDVSMHETNRQRPEVVRKLMAEYPYQLKFVVDVPEDLLDVEEYLESLGEVKAERVYLMPMATEVSEMHAREDWIRPFAARRGYRYCPRMQLEWYGNRRGT